MSVLKLRMRGNIVPQLQSRLTVTYINPKREQGWLENCNKGVGLYGLGAAFTLPLRLSRNPPHGR